MGTGRASGFAAPQASRFERPTGTDLPQCRPLPLSMPLLVIPQTAYFCTSVDLANLAREAGVSQRLSQSAASTKARTALACTGRVGERLLPLSH